MKKIGIIAGDGTGPEVIEAALTVLAAVEMRWGLAIEKTFLPYGGNHYLKTGETITDDQCAQLKAFDAVLLGAIGHPEVKPGVLEKGILLKIRFDLDQYINLRPVKLYANVETPLKDKTPDDIDYVVIRENSGGLYTGTGGISMKNTPHEVAIQSMVYSRYQVERCIRYAFEYTRKRHRDVVWRGLSDADLQAGYRGKLTLCGKTNVLTYVFDLWQRVFDEVAAEYPEIKPDYTHVDATTMWMVKNPEWFDVIVTENMFGDIITDLGAITQGGMGIAAGGNINPTGVSMFEPIGGSAPKYTGLGVINPLACIGALQLMLDHLGYSEPATQIESAIQTAILQLPSMNAGKMGMTTSAVGKLVADLLVK